MKNLLLLVLLLMALPVFAEFELEPGAKVSCEDVKVGAVVSCKANKNRLSGYFMAVEKYGPQGFSLRTAENMDRLKRLVEEKCNEMVPGAKPVEGMYQFVTAYWNGESPHVSFMYGTTLCQAPSPSANTDEPIIKNPLK